MHRNVTILIIVLLVLVVGLYFIWIRNKMMGPSVEPVVIPTQAPLKIELTPTLELSSTESTSTGTNSSQVQIQD